MDAGGSGDAAAASPLRTRKGPLPPVQLPNSMRNAQLAALGSEPSAELRLPSITGNTEKTTQALCPSPLRAARTGSALHGNAAAIDIDAIERSPSPVLLGAHRRKSLSPAKQRVGSGVSPASLRRQQRSPEPLRRLASTESSSNDDIPAIYLNSGGEPGAGFRSSSSSESLGEASTASASSSGNVFRSTRGTTSSHLTTLRDFSSLSRSLPSLTEEEAPRRSSMPTVNRSLLGASLSRSGSYDSEIGTPYGDGASSSSSGMRYRHSNPSTTLASKSLASMASPMASRRRTRHSPTPLGMGDLCPDMAAGMLYSKDVPSSRRRSKTVSPEPIPEDDIAPSPSLPRRRSPSPQPPVHASGIPVSPLATMGGGGVPTRHVSLPGSFQMMATSPRRSRPNNVNILARSMSPARAASLDSSEEQSLTALSPVKELEADDEDTDGGDVLGDGFHHARSSRSKSFGEIDALSAAGGIDSTLVMPAIQSHMPKAVTMDDLQAARRLFPAAGTAPTVPSSCSAFAEDDEDDEQ